MILTVDDFTKDDRIRINDERCLEYFSKYVEVEKLKIPRNIRENMNKKISDALLIYLVNSDLQEKKCYLIKNIVDGEEEIFVHEYDGSCKRFKNIDTAKLSGHYNINDVLVLKDDKYIVDASASNIIKNIINDTLDELEATEKLFQIEGNEYFVCEKSDDDILPQVNLRIPGTNKEFWGIKVDKELYNDVVYGTIVRYEKGKYVIVNKK